MPGTLTRGTDIFSTAGRWRRPGAPTGSGNQSSISRAADSGESEPCTRLNWVSRPKSPRIVPGVAFSTGSVPPASCAERAIARGPSTTAATTGPAGDELEQPLVERLALVLGVVLLGQLAVDRAQLQRDEVEPLALDPGEDLADQPAPDAVGLDQDQGAFGHGAA